MARSSAPVEPVPLVPFADVVRSMGWGQGEHVALVGPTGAGKTVAALALTDVRRARGGYCLLTSTKPSDPTLAGMRRKGWRTISAWPPPAETPAVIVHAPIIDLDDDPIPVGRVIRKALNGAYRQGRWCVVLDDLQVLNDACNLHRATRMLLLNARSSKVTIIVGTQRPRWVPREVWTQSVHLFIWRCTDADDLRALSGLGNADTARVRSAVASLDWDRHECLYVNTRTGRLARTTVPR